MNQIIKKQPDFYLASTEGYDLEEPRKCWKIKRLITQSRDDLLFVKVDPPIKYNDYKQGVLFLNYVIIAARHVGVSVLSISAWPVYVHVAKLRRTSLSDNSRLKDNEIETIAWAELYQTEEDAKKKTW